MGINTEHDLIYQDLLKTYSKEELELELALNPVDDSENFEEMLNSEAVKQRLIRSKYMSFGGNATATDAIKLLLLHREYITMEQLGFLKLFSQRSDTASSMITKLINGGGPDKKPLLKSQPINSSLSQEKVYYLSTPAKLQLLESFPVRYLADNFIDTSDRAPSLGVQLQHDVELLNIFYYLLASYDFMIFKWLTNLEFNPSDNPDTPLRKLVSRIAPEKTGLLRPDAVILSEDTSSLLSSLAVFVEQDMRTERESSLKQKFAGYAAFYGSRNRSCLPLEEIVFTISTKGIGTTPMGGLLESQKPAGYTESATKTRNDVLAYIEKAGTKEVPALIAGLSNILAESRTGKKTSNKIINEVSMKKKFLLAAVAYAPNLDVSDAVRAYEKHLRDLAAQSKERQIGKACEKQVSKRYEVIRAAALSEPDFKQMLLDGYSLHVTDSSRPHILPYHLIQGYQTYEKLAALVKKKYIKKNFKHTFEPSYSYVTGGRTYTLKNCMKSIQGDIAPIFFENVSGDIGGELRVKTFLTEGIQNQTQIYLFLLVKSEAAARDFEQSFMELISTTPGNRFRKQGDAFTVRGGIHIAYISYEGEESLKNVFVVDAEGNILQC